MNRKQVLVEKWQNLPEDKQKEVIDFVEFLESRLHQKDSKYLDKNKRCYVTKC